MKTRWLLCFFNGLFLMSGKKKKKIIEKNNGGIKLDLEITTYF